MESIGQVARQDEQIRQLRASNEALTMQLTALKPEVAVLKTNQQQQAQHRLIRGHYKRRAPVRQPVEVGAVVAAQPGEPSRK